MFSPYIQSSSSSLTGDALFSFESLPLSSSLASDFDLGSALSSSAYALDSHLPSLNFSLLNDPSSSGSDPDSGSDSPSPVNDDGGVYYNSVFAAPGSVGIPPIHAFSSSAMAGDGIQTSSPFVFGNGLTGASLQQPLGGLSSVASSSTTTTKSGRGRKRTTASSSRTSKSSPSSAVPSQVLPSISPLLSAPLTASSTTLQAGAASASATAAVLTTPPTAASGAAAARKPKRSRKTTSTKKVKVEKDSGSNNDDDDMPASELSASASSSSDVPTANGVVTVPAQKLRKLKEDAELKRKRLDRKAELARNSRRKKKQRVVELEEQVATLQMQLNDSVTRSKDMESHCHVLTVQAQNAAMQVQAANAAANDAIAQAQAAQAAASSAVTLATTAAVSSSTSAATCGSCANGKVLRPDDVAGLADSIVSLTADPECKITASLQAVQRASTSGNAELTSVALGQVSSAVSDLSKLTQNSMDLLDKLLVPSMPIRVLRWAMSQSDKFYADANGLWNCLLKQDCGVTARQMVQLDELRATFKNASSQQATSLAFFEQAGAPGQPLDLPNLLSKALIEARQQVTQNEACFHAFRSILSAEQMVKFLSWVERYGNVVVRINV